MRSTIAQWNTKSLAVSQGDVHTELSGRLEERQGQEVRGADCHRSMFPKRILFIPALPFSHLIPFLKLLVLTYLASATAFEKSVTLPYVLGYWKMTPEISFLE